jgi:CrcB protein
VSVKVDYLWIGLGGFLGVNARYIMGRAVADRLGTAFPYGTLLVNLLGAFLVGVLLTLVTEHVLADPFWRQLAVVGFLGGFTTFSAYTFETVALLEEGRWGAGLGYVAVSNLLGVMFCVAGVVLTRLAVR